jgi:hypothetical protein
MAISWDLAVRYSVEVDIDWHHAFILYHPQAGWRYLIDYTEEYEASAFGEIVPFSPVPTQLSLPTRDAEGRQDFGIVWCGISGEAAAYIEAAMVDPTIPITCYYSIFIIGNQLAQIDPWFTLTLTNISVAEDTVTATATRADILNKAFPSEVYRVDRFPGLRRH